MYAVPELNQRTTQNKKLDSLVVAAGKMTFITKWNVPCATEGKTHTVWSIETPCKCPISDSHAIDHDNIEVLSKMSEDEYAIPMTRIYENMDLTQGLFRSHTFKMVCHPGESTHVLNFPYLISILSIKLNTRADQVGDDLDVYAERNMPGRIIVGGAAGSARISLSAPLHSMAHRGLEVVLMPSNTTLGEIKHVYNTNVALVTPLPFDVATDTECKLTRACIKNMYIDTPAMLCIGESKIGSTVLYPFMNLHITYRNKSLVAKDLVFTLEYTY